MRRFFQSDFSSGVKCSPLAPIGGLPIVAVNPHAQMDRLWGFPKKPKAETLNSNESHSRGVPCRDGTC